MILNFHALLAGTLDLLRLLLGAAVAGLAWATWREWRAAATPEARAAVEDRLYLLSLLGFFLLGLNLVSWPLLYLVLQSYVPEWPGVMCVYGVSRVGADSQGASRFLPLLLQLLQVLKPALLFVIGAWAVLYGVHRRGATTALLGRLLLLLLLAGLVSAADAAAEVAYLLIPKRQEFLAAGCCTVSDALGAVAVRREGQFGAAGRAWLTGGYYGVNLLLFLALRRRLARGIVGRPAASPVPLLLLAGAAVVIGAAFLTEVLAPAVLGLPYHRCAYDLIGGAPELLLGVALFASGTFAVGWAAAARYLARVPETAAFVPEIERRLLRGAGYGYFYSLALVSAALWVAP